MIPEYWRRDLDEIGNNLPVPEYDDTGFIGRKSERQSVLRLLYGPHRIVTITGEGGVGKTSLALQTLYDIAADPKRPFDHIVWVTLKTQTLTTAGVRQIADALTTPDKLLEQVASTAGAVPNFDSFEGLVAYVHEVMTGVRVLLAIDNFETIDRDALRPFFLDLPESTKVLITSRYGLGEFETRYALSEMDQVDAVRLVRSLAQLLTAHDLLRRPDKQLADICKALFFNPLALRWFVQSYSHGRAISDLTQRRRGLEEVLNYCFHTLYESLSEDQRQYLRIMVAVGRPLSEVQLALIAGAGSLDELRSSLHYLHSSNLVRRTSDEWATSPGSLWTISDFARAYVTGRDSRVVAERLDIVRRYKALLRARDDARDETYTNPYRSRAIAARTTDEASVVYLLRQAFDARDARDFRLAIDFVDKAKRLQGSFYEVWRVSAQVKADADPLGAQQDFERAIELADGGTDPLLAFAAHFLINQHDESTAVELLETRAQEADADVRLVAWYARALGLAGDLGRSLVQFRRVNDRLTELGGSEQAVILTQFIEMLRRAAEVELERGSPEAAVAHHLEALDLARLALARNSVDRVLVQEARETIDAACTVIARSCSRSSWDALADRLVDLREYIPLSSPMFNGAHLLSVRCSGIASLESFRETLGAQASPPTFLFGDSLAPIASRDYTFIRGDDGRDYFLHRNQLVDPDDWHEIGRHGRSRIRFQPGTARADRSAPALSAVVLRLDA